METVSLRLRSWFICPSDFAAEEVDNARRWRKRRTACPPPAVDGLSPAYLRSGIPHSARSDYSEGGPAFAPFQSLRRSVRFRPVADEMRFCEAASMTVRTATMLLAMTTLAGCAGQSATIASGGSAFGNPAEYPSGANIKSAFDTLLRSRCRDATTCDLPWLHEPTSPECGPTTRRNQIRCTFFTGEQRGISGPCADLCTGISLELRECAGIFQRAGDGWRMLSIIGQCLPRGRDGSPR